MSSLEPTSTYLELRESTASGEAAAGLSHTPGGLFLLHVQELATAGEPAGGITLVHGAGDHGGRYLGVARELAEGGWAVALPDLRGHGKSEGARGHSAGANELVRDLEAVQEHLAYRLPVAPKVLVGQGLGALYALAYAVERPGSVAALCLLGPVLEPRFELPKSPGGLLGRFKKQSPETPGSLGIAPEARFDDPDEAAAWRADELAHDVITVAAAGHVEEMARAFPARIGAVGAPVLVLHGAEDRVSPPSASAVLERDGVERRVVAGRGHDLLHGPGAGALCAELLEWIGSRVDS